MVLADPCLQRHLKADASHQLQSQTVDRFTPPADSQLIVQLQASLLL